MNMINHQSDQWWWWSGCYRDQNGNHKLELDVLFQNHNRMNINTNRSRI